MTQPDPPNRRIGEWRRFSMLMGVNADRRCGVDRRADAERRSSGDVAPWLGSERRRDGDRRRADERRAGPERRSGRDRRRP